MKVCTNTVLFSAFLHDTLLIETSELNLTSFPRWGCVLEVHAWHLWTLDCNCPLYLEGPLITPSFPPSSSFHLPPVFLFSICHLHNLLYYSAPSKAWFLFIYFFTTPTLPSCFLHLLCWPTSPSLRLPPQCLHPPPISFPCLSLLVPLYPQHFPFPQLSSRYRDIIYLFPSHELMSGGHVANSPQ